VSGLNKLILIKKDWPVLDKDTDYRDALAEVMVRHGFSTRHGDTIFSFCDLLKELDAQIMLSRYIIRQISKMVDHKDLSDSDVEIPRTLQDLVKSAKMKT
jgi:hypothetical protein